MKITDLKTGDILPFAPCDTVLAVGNFDGVHKGHAALIKKAKELACSLGCACAVWSFEQYTPRCRGVCITPPEKRGELFRSLGADYLFTCEYERVCDMSCDAFVNNILKGGCRAKAAVCGYNFRFGAGASGDAQKLSQLIDTHVIKAVAYKGEPVSSTAIRGYLASGDMEKVSGMLGRRYSVSLPVMHGRHLGTKLDFPTINQNFPAGTAIPRRGVYACIARVDKALYPAASNVGTRPTVDDGIINCETHIIGYNGDLYGKEAEVSFISFIRPEMKFASLDELKAQIKTDICSVKTIFERDKIMYTPLKITKKKIIVDTDIGPDCDDAGSLSVLFTLAKKYDVPVAGIMHCCSNPYGAPAADAIATYFGYNIPIGTYEKSGYLDEPYCIIYNKFLSENYPRSHSQYPSQVKLYRKILAESEDDGIVICTIGPLNNVSALIDSEPDEYSPLDGLTLFNKKVSAVVAMAGTFPEGALRGREFNIVCDAPAAKNFFGKITPPVYLDGAELGIRILTGYEEEGDGTNPVQKAYRLLRPGNGINASFDLLAVHFAFEGEGEFYSLSERGRFEINAEGDGESAFIYDENGNFRIMFFAASVEKITDAINGMLIGK